MKAANATAPSNAALQLRASAPVSCKLLLDRASAPEALQCRADESDGNGRVLHDDVSRNAEHAIPEAREIPIPPRVGGALPSVDGTIHFHDQPHRGSDEVCDVPATEHHLPAKGNTEATTAELPPESAVRLLREEPHAPSAGGEKVLGAGVMVREGLSMAM